ncbi:transketolase [Virgibacillus necropolis]|uniref:Transketolase n=1 Tax=Virgibacillus necropolis TaxID=163877 RepID=A0A221M9I2_9BACI|nr:transketolase [Virgibacillus necropolis]ASN04303.1 transketolase [Virgibacillus necropolis]
MKTLTQENVAELSIATIRTLSIDSVEHAKHGHLGMPLGSAPMAYKLFKDVMKHNPKNPKWYDRDRFILTSGHGSILLYTLLHLSGYNVSIEDLKEFRQLGSITPGHPEVDVTPGVEATTGPLGQGISTTVGFAIAERNLAHTYNKEDISIVDHYTYTICGDGDLMEGVAQEAMSLAGHLGLGKLIVLYDSNDVCSDGFVSDSNTEDVQKKYEAMGWQTLYVEDGNDISAVQQAIDSAKTETNKPSLIEVKNIIGFGSPNFGGTAAIHSNPVGDDESKLIKQAYKWLHEEKFFIPEEVKEDFAEIVSKGSEVEKDWNNRFKDYQGKYPELAKQFIDSMDNKVEIEDVKLEFTEDKMATRAASGKVLNSLAKQIPSLIGGSADLASSNKTTIDGNTFMTKGDYKGPNIHFGIREFSMASIVNGLALHGGVKGYSGTFLVFADYMKAAIRMSAIINRPVTYVFTHDSIMLGQDGPTHQPVEQLASLRATPNLNVIRPADANETKAAWSIAINSKGTPTAIILGRHDVPVLPHASVEGVKRGAYIISEGKDELSGIIIASGSEVELALKAQQLLEKDGVSINVVSMPSWELFNQQDMDYKNQVLPPVITNKLVVEMGSPIGWREYVGPKGEIWGIDDFGESGNGNALAEKLGFTSENIVHIYKTMLERNQ